MIPASKSELRRMMLERRASIAPDRRRDWNRRIEEQILGSALWRAAHAVMAYCSLPDEAATQGILAAAVETGKRLLLPRRVPGRKRFEAVEVRDLERDLAPTSLRGLVEPLLGPPPYENANTVDLIIIPGVAFDRRGLRLGFGGGMYDRFLAECPAPYRLALAYSIQIIDETPRSNHDESVHGILTEEGWIDIPTIRHQGSLDSN